MLYGIFCEYGWLLNMYSIYINPGRSVIGPVSLHDNSSFFLTDFAQDAVVGDTGDVPYGILRVVFVCGEVKRL